MLLHQAPDKTQIRKILKRQA